MSISSVIGNFRGDCPVWRFEVGEFFPVRMGMEEKVSRKRFGNEDNILPPLRRDFILEKLY
jgi:hypothetical protein